jgi:hypothetical protein
MGGRGASSASNPFYYRNSEWIENEIEKTVAERTAALRASRLNGESPAIKRRRAWGIRKLSEIQQKMEQLDKALEKSRKRNNVPF